MLVLLQAVCITVLTLLLIGRLQLLERLLLNHSFNLKTVDDFNILYRSLAETRLLKVVLRLIFLVLLGFCCYRLLVILM
ncbi:non-structural protein 7 [Porcine respiratory coronavirus 137]|uniref:Non-structural protein 7 n=2 Tax=Porcine respiratory coronavirus TaxID=11146 RepID=NS7_CVPR8|nr:RecName: Full=Non-structural protein 7; Short=ns7; AltName: Full=9 kDa hydrophobic protein; Short=HP; AltName: Full=Accessory protein 7; AltName: Full=X3 protein; Flags: Precursor [Porcine respiratory coronavirus (strain 86/137004 / British isolate)]P69613.1 RecName: Full=Non-structural protein 7; Short=ns7; AltName: Full=9 kDa hydrophobic protein; Short=HP; AltName: Full=Accessory protein 7; AltName: Full=X3 protein; Flags: Precursor [Porcine respiratory coronavirus (STRAIN RM4)]URY50794.1 no